MHLLYIGFHNARENGSGKLDLRGETGDVRKWTLLPTGPCGRELLHLIAAVCGGTELFPRLPFPLGRLCRDPARPLQVECELSVRAPFEIRQSSAHWGIGVRIDGEGRVRGLRSHEYRLLPVGASRRKARTGLGNSWLFLLGYGGPELHHHDGTDDFDFSDPYFRATRFHSLFLGRAPLTDPTEFLAGMHYRAVRQKRLGATHILERVARLAGEHLGVDTRRWMERGCDFKQEWKDLEPWRRRALLPALDAARHLFCAFPKWAGPLDIPALILFNRPDRLYTGKMLSRWTRFMDLLLPEAQFLVTMADRPRKDLPEEVLTRSLDLPVPKERTGAKRSPSLVQVPRGTVLLLDVDGTLPNLALMKLSRYFKDQGKNVVLARREAFVKGVEAVYASCVFFRPATEARLGALRKYYGDSLVAGGSGVDVRGRLPEEIEKLPADYDLYPELGDRAIGFLTRGCPFHCPFCIVPEKEGGTRKVCDLSDLLPDGRRKLILLDDNILAYPGAGDLFEEMASRDLDVCFTQTLDMRLVDQETARLLKRVACSNLKFTRRVYHFSLNDCRNIEEVRRKYGMFGFLNRDNVEFIFMYGFNTTLAEDVERLRFLRSLPGAYVFTQKYQPVPGGPPPREADFFDGRADELIDELIGILFRQNMKSVENYYRWVSKRYAETFGLLHQGLVDTIFRYNNRQKRGYYMAEMVRRES